MLAVALIGALVVVGAVLVVRATTADEGGAAGQRAPTIDLGDQSDPVALGQTVGEALRTGRGQDPPRGDPPCAQATRAEFGQGVGPLVYAASLRWQGTPAVVLAYRVAEPAAPGLDHRVFVMSRRGCRLLVTQSL